ncbi:MAG TPA: glycoside hydrolase family 127 protein [Verrucomicrobiae bacterium]|nr:glycoside hydrolase family 127 protein [Verrucomicrobiae bacterium]
MNANLRSAGSQTCPASAISRRRRGDTADSEGRAASPRLRRLVQLLLFVALFVPSRVAAAEIGARPHAAVQPIAPGEARWTSGFWADRIELCRTSTLPALWRIMEGTNHTHFLQNFRIAVGDAEGRYRGATFNDGEVYKVLEASIAMLSMTNDPTLSAQVDSAIELIARAQRDDGYLHTQVLVRQRNGDTNAVPFQNRHNFEMYNMGHLMTTAALHHRVTGKTNLLSVARKAANFMQRTFNEASPEAARSSVCPSHYMGIVDLYRVTGEAEYLSLARRFFALRSQITDGGDDNQDRIPFEQQTNAVGHAVRANYLYAGAADLFMESGDKTLWNPLEPIWSNLVQQKMYITGGCGALYDGASPDASRDQRSITRTHQAYGRNYQLPNTTAHNETCANIGNVLWNWRMFLATGEARFIDVAELAMHNSVLSGMSLDGTNFFYVNPLRTTDPLPTELRWKHQRVPFISSFCCPPNLARTLAHSPEFAYAKSDRTVWINLYGGSRLNTEVPGIGRVKLLQETEFPWSGRVRVRVEESSGTEFSMKLRIPEWADGFTVRVNQQPVGTSETTAGTYVELKREWKPGDLVDVDLEMPIRLLEANPLVEETVGQLAFKRGPTVYCVESTDLPAGVKPHDVVISPATEFLARHDTRLLGGVVTLDGVVGIRTNAPWGKELYRQVQPAAARQQRIRLVPYSTWQNRGASEMSVWLRRE